MCVCVYFFFSFTFPKLCMQSQVSSSSFHGLSLNIFRLRFECQKLVVGSHRGERLRAVFDIAVLVVWLCFSEWLTMGKIVVSSLDFFFLYFSYMFYKLLSISLTSFVYLDGNYYHGHNNPNAVGIPVISPVLNQIFCDHGCRLRVVYLFHNQLSVCKLQNELPKFRGHP